MRVSHALGAIAAVATLTCTLALAAPAADAASGPPTTATQLQIVVSAHPDDELQAWAEIAGHEGTYTVFVTSTHGERTGYCDPETFRQALRPELAEWAPSVSPDGRGSASCARARDESWARFLDQAAEIDPSVGLGAVALTGTVAVSAVHGLAPAVNGDGEPTSVVPVTVGTAGARIMFDSGDGNLTVDEVRWEVWSVLGMRGQVLPDLPLAQVIGAGYWNDSPQHGANVAAVGAVCRSDCPGESAGAEYEHPDHRAVHVALRATDFGARDGNLLPVAPTDPAATDRRTLSDLDYAAFMAVDESTGARAGIFQTVFGWLHFGSDRLAGPWPSSAEASYTRGEARILPQRETFIRVTTAAPLPLQRGRVGGTTPSGAAAGLARTVSATARTAILVPVDQSHLLEAAIAAPLARRLGAVVLAVTRQSVPRATLTELTRRGVRTVFLVGTDGSLAPGLDAQLRRAGVRRVTRVGGRDLTTVSLAAAALMGHPGTVVAVDPGQGTLAAAASGAAAVLGAPIIVTPAVGHSMSTAAKSALAKLQASRGVQVGRARLPAIPGMKAATPLPGGAWNVAIGLARLLRPSAATQVVVTCPVTGDLSSCALAGSLGHPLLLAGTQGVAASAAAVGRPWRPRAVVAVGAVSDHSLATAAAQLAWQTS